MEVEKRGTRLAEADSDRYAGCFLFDFHQKGNVQDACFLQGEAASCSSLSNRLGEELQRR